MAKKIKPLSKRRPFRRWIRRLFGRRPRPWAVGPIDEMHEHRDEAAEYLRPLYKTEEEREEAPLLWPKVNPNLVRQTAPLWCRVKARLLISPSPSAMLCKCSLGLRHGRGQRCKMCAANMGENIVENLLKASRPD